MSAFRPPLDMRRRSSGRGLPTTTSLHPVGPSPDIRSSMTAGNSNGTTANGSLGGVDNVKSPGELTVFVDKLLIDLETKFEQMSTEVLDKMNQMSNRIDNLEHSIAELISTSLDDEPLQTPNTNPTTSTSSYITAVSSATGSGRRSNGKVNEVRSDGARSPPMSGMGRGGPDAPSLLLTSPSLGDLGASGDRDGSTEDDSTIRAT